MASSELVSVNPTASGSGRGAELRAWRVRVPPGTEADPGPLPREAEGQGAVPEDAVLFRTSHLGLPLARIPVAAFPLRADGHGCVEPGGLGGAEILVEPPARRHAKYECLYLQGIVGMSGAFRIERASQGQPSTAALHQELAFLQKAAWWFHLSALIAGEAPANPEERHHRARAKASMLIRRIETGNHFEMPSHEFVDLLE